MDKGYLGLMEVVGTRRNFTHFGGNWNVIFTILGPRREGWAGGEGHGEMSKCVRVCVCLFRYNYEHEKSVVKTVKNISESMNWN